MPKDMVSKDIQKEALNEIRDNILPAIKSLGEFLHGEYSNHLRKEIGASSLQSGFYQAAIDYYSDHDPSLNPTVLHEMGLEQIKSLQQGVLELSNTMGYNTTSFKEFAKLINDEPDQKFSSPEETLKYYSDAVHKTIKNKLSTVLPDDLVNSDLLDIKIEQLPDGQNGFAFAQGASYDGRRKGIYLLGSNNYENFRKYEAVYLGLHEAAPGHLFHLGLINKANLSDILRVTAYSFSTAQSHFPIYGAFTEGWGLYSEFLGYEMGLYDNDPVQQIGYYSGNLIRAARLVVDTGIHAFGWSRQKAIDYLFDNTLMTKGAAIGGIDRYITWPGQALSYKIGERKMKMIRSIFEEELGESFDLKEFHRNVLLCSGPLTLLEDCIRRKVNN